MTNFNSMYITNFLQFIEKYFNISHDVSVTLFVTLTIFILGYIIKGIALTISGYLKRTSTRKMFLTTLKSLQKSVSIQDEALGRTIKTINFEKNSQWVYQKVNFFQLLAFKEIGYKESFNCFFHGFENYFAFWRCKDYRELRRKAFNRSWSMFENIEFWSKKAIEDFYKYEQRYNTFGEKRNIEMDKLRKMWESIFSQSITSPTHLNYVKELDKITSEYSKIPTIQRVSPYITNRRLILKIRILNRRYFKGGLTDGLTFIVDINNQCVSVSHEYIDMEYLARNVKDQYEVYKASFYSYKRYITRIVRIL
jgi:hypothetical protein